MADTSIYTSVEGEVIYEDKHLIHYISSQRLDFRLNLFASLLYEFSLFEKYGYDFKSYRRNYCVTGQDKGNSIKRILETPIDFTEVLKEKYGVQQLLNKASLHMKEIKTYRKLEISGARTFIDI